MQQMLPTLMAAMHRELLSEPLPCGTWSYCSVTGFRMRTTYSWSEDGLLMSEEIFWCDNGETVLSPCPSCWADYDNYLGTSSHIVWMPQTRVVSDNGTVVVAVGDVYEAYREDGRVLFERLEPLLWDECGLEPGFWYGRGARQAPCTLSVLFGNGWGYGEVPNDDGDARQVRVLVQWPTSELGRRPSCV